MPKMGFLTSARRKRCTTLSPGSRSKKDLLPNVQMDMPFAARRTAKLCLLLAEGDAGKTETSAPLSTRKERRRRWQKTEREPSWVAEEREEMAGCGVVEETPGVTGDPRRERFPKRPKILVAAVAGEALGGECGASGNSST